MRTTTVRTLSELIAYKCKLPRDDLTLAGLDRAVIEIQMIVRRECAEMAKEHATGHEAYEAIEDFAMDEHKRDQPLARSVLHALIDYHCENPPSS